jgi:RNA polymerase sigma factor (sigma-70 family)
MRKSWNDYEGLVCSTASMYQRLVGVELEDLQQILRVRVWRAIEAHDADRVNGPTLDSFVFTCVSNQVIDLMKAKLRREPCVCGHGRIRHEHLKACGHRGCECSEYRGMKTSYIEEIAPDSSLELPGARDRFEMAHLSEAAYELDDVALPTSLNVMERSIVGLLYVGYRQVEIAEMLGVQRRDVERGMRSLRAKLADWRPSATGQGELIQLEVRVRRAVQRAA